MCYTFRNSGSEIHKNQFTSISFILFSIIYLILYAFYIIVIILELSEAMSFNLFRHNINISMTKAIVKELRKED